MHRFYNQTLLVLAALLAASLLLAWACVSLSYTHVPLLPINKSRFPSRVVTTSDSAKGGGHSSARIVATEPLLRFEYGIEKGFATPYAAVELWFVGRDGEPALVDLSQYTSLSFVAQCSRPQALTLTVPSFDPKISVRSEVLTYRTQWTFFPCGERPGRIELDLTRLETPQWWYDLFKVDVLRHGYVLNQVPKIAFGSAPGAIPGGVHRIDIGSLELNGRDYRWLALLGVLEVLAWGGFGVWLFRAHARALTDNVNSRLRTDRPLVEYQQLTIEPHRDREKADILHYIATNYSNPDLDIDMVASNTATGRAKINDVVKSSFGHTLAGYVNKLRLTEAARLLSESQNATVAEIAYSVGYANVSYFNKLFKEEYGCTPKAFRAGSQ